MNSEHVKAFQLTRQTTQNV